MGRWVALLGILGGCAYTLEPQVGATARDARTDGGTVEAGADGTLAPDTRLVCVIDRDAGETYVLTCAAACCPVSRYERGRSCTDDGRCGLPECAPGAVLSDAGRCAPAPG